MSVNCFVCVCLWVGGCLCVCVCVCVCVLFKKIRGIAVYNRSSDNDQPAGWDTPPMCKIRGDNAVYFLVLLLIPFTRNRLGDWAHCYLWQ